MQTYQYRPVRFYLTVFAATWSLWGLALAGPWPGAVMPLMFLGLCAPAAVAVATVLRSGSSPLKADFRRKLAGFYRLRPGNILAAVALFGAVVAVSILLSTLFGQSLDQFALVQGFSFSIQGSPALLTILLASVIEEVGWRGYGEDSIAQSLSWFWESILFGLVWSLWHLPLFFLPGTYHAGLAQLGPLYALNFFVSCMPLGFITTWVYVKNGRSMLACILFHLFVNFFQEKIAMTPETKCVETLVIALAAVLLVLANRDLFFETRHVGRLPNA